jgi:hypothetical protein
MPATRRPKKVKTEPEWMNPRKPIPTSALSHPLLERALDALGVDGQIAEIEATDRIIAAVIVAQALDRLGRNIIEGAAVGRVVVRQ